MPKENLRDKLEGNELDLSLNNLTVVPVKELALLPKATRLDLSCNSITSLPDAFCSLHHLVKIDLSKNALQELPQNFGHLQNLQHLDLLGNQLSVLPISFFQLRKLKWLDLKDNPLKEDLKKQAGDCLDEAQCKKCAQRVLEYMKGINSAVEREKQKKLAIEREREAAQKALEEEEMRLKREARKRAKAERHKQQQLQREENNVRNEEENQGNKTGVEEREINGKQQQMKQTTVKKSQCCSWTLCFGVFALIIAVIVGIIVYQEEIKGNPLYQQHVKPYWEIYGSPTWQKVSVFCNEKTRDIMALINGNASLSGESTNQKLDKQDPADSMKGTKKS